MVEIKQFNPKICQMWVMLVRVHPRGRWRDAGNEVELQILLQKSDSTVWPFPEAYIHKGNEKQDQ